jgi:hypothetical protein
MLTAALVVDDGPITPVCADLIARSERSDHYRITLLVVDATASRGGTIRDAVYRLLQRLERASLRASSHLPAASHDELTPGDFGLPRVILASEPAGKGSPHRDDVLPRIGEAGIDVLVDTRLSGNPPTGVGIGTRHGILNGRHLRPPGAREGPPGFWEAMRREPCTSFEIRRIHGGGDLTVMRSSIPTDPFCVATERRLRRRCILSMHPLLEELGRSGTLRAETAADAELTGRSGAPSLLHQAAYAVSRIPVVARRAVDRLLRRGLLWNVAYQFADDWRSADLGESITIPNPPHRCLADPFLWERDGVVVCFVEDFDIGSRRGRIAAYRIGEDGHEALGDALREPFHLSYPFVFEAHGELFMCPESLDNEDIRVYRCVDFPLEWRLHKVLMSNVSAVDTSIVFHSGRWWMLTGIDPSATGEGFDLHVFWAEAFDAEHWTPHPGNPVVTGCGRARNGGLITDDGRLLRVYQIQGFGVYGESFGVAEIVRLTEDDYEERIVARIEPRFLPGISGTHTMAFRNGTLAIDYLRRARYTR